MLVPSIFGENLFDDWFDVDFPQCLNSGIWIGQKESFTAGMRTG